MENQFTQLKREEAVNIDTSRPKVASVGILGVLFAGLFGYFLNSSILDKGLENVLYALVAAIGFLAIFLLQVFFIKSNKIVNLLLLLETSALAAPFLHSVSWSLFLAWLSSLVLFWVAAKRGKIELGNQLKIKFFRVERFVIPGALTAISLFIALVYLSVFEFNGLIISKKSFQDLIQPSATVVGAYVDNFSYGMTMAELAEAIAVKQLGERARQVPRSVRTVAVNQVLDQLKEQSRGYGISFKNSDTISDVLYNYLAGQLNKIPDNLKIIVPMLFVLILFLTIKGIAVLFRWAVSIPAYLLYNIALATGFAMRGIESRSREIILLK